MLVYMVERKDNETDGWHIDPSFRSMLTRKEAASLVSALRKTMHRSINWTVATVEVTPDGFDDGAYSVRRNKHNHAFGTNCHTRCPRWGVASTGTGWFATA